MAKPLTRRLLVRVAKSKAFLWCAGVGGGVLLIVIIISSVVSAATAPAIAFLNAAAHFFGDSEVDTDAEVSDLLDSCLDSADPKTYLEFISHLPGNMDAEELQSYVLYLNAAPTPPSTSTSPALPSATPSAAPPASTSSTASTGDPRYDAFTTLWNQSTPVPRRTDSPWPTIPPRLQRAVPNLDQNAARDAAPAALATVLGAAREGVVSLSEDDKFAIGVSLVDLCSEPASRTPHATTFPSTSSGAPR